jgi:hypothetical protein
MAPQAQMPSQHKQPSACQRLFAGRQGPPGQRIVRPPWPSWRNSISRPPSSSHQCSPSRSTLILQLRKGPAASLHFNGTSNEVVPGDSGDRPVSDPEACPGRFAWESPRGPGEALAWAINLETAIAPVIVITPERTIAPVTAIAPIKANGPATAVTPATSH